MKKFAVGVDIGGSHVSAVLVNITSKEILKDTYAEEPINNQAEAPEILQVWADTIKQSISNIDVSELKGVGFAMPGPFDYHKGVALFERVKKFESLYGINVGDELRNLLQLPYDVSFRFINDASAFAIGEAWIGKARETKKSLALTLGTGFGSAFISDGAPLLSGTGVPEMGCVWHLPYKEGIADDYFSTRWFVENYFQSTGERVKGVKELADRFYKDEKARKLFFNYGSGLGKFLLPWIKEFEPEMIVIGGNIVGAWSLFGIYMENELMNSGISIPIELSSLKENAAMIGSSRLIIDNYYEQVEALLPLM